MCVCVCVVWGTVVGVLVGVEVGMRVWVWGVEVDWNLCVCVDCGRRGESVHRSSSHTHHPSFRCIAPINPKEPLHNSVLCDEPVMESDAGGYHQ